MEGNAFRKIEGLALLTNLRCLYLQENMIGRIEGLETLTGLANLNLSDNLIERVEGLGSLTNLSNLQLKRNRIGGAGLEDVTGLLECPSISALDISDNKVETEEFLPEVLQKMGSLAVVYLQNNEFTKKVPHYRKTLISRIPTLKYIDDRPVFEDELRYAQAWARGGLEEERKERAAYKKEKEDEQVRQHEQFRAMIDRFKEEGKRAKERAESSESDSEVNSKPESL
jgi:dynein assembly factor 1, axonemal